ncbi:MAG: hypothetical protein LBF97_00710 [Elusimicrobiota bacterium]|jgi:hypothetical protein|nr:hypothetical protein [Elusimicrobiota bacterium]
MKYFVSFNWYVSSLNNYCLSSNRVIERDKTICNEKDIREIENEIKIEFESERDKYKIFSGANINISLINWRRMEDAI